MLCNFFCLNIIIITVSNYNNRLFVRMENIWTFEENQSIETDKVDMKPFKPTGRFFDDV